MRIDLSKYPTTAEKIAYLVANKRELVEFKRSEPLKRADAIGTNDSEIFTVKALNTHYNDDPSTGIIKRTIIGNTYNWMDSHDDVHLEGTFTKSLTERQTKIWHLHDHEYKITAKVGTPIKIYEKSIPWTDLGVSKSGNTTSLMMDSNITKSMNDLIFGEYLSGQITQHSVGMQYIKLDLAVNDPQYKDEFNTWNTYIHLLGNRQKAEEKGYFWAVKEARLIEISAVLEGSNELTPTVSNQPNNTGKNNSQNKNFYSYLQ